jgi:nucleoside 2-deoxyribosyltransferase
MNQSKQKIYIAGPISGHDLEERKETFSNVQKALEKIGYEVVNPMELPHDHDKSWESYMKECILHLVQCDCIYMLDNWHFSAGARLEFNIALQLGFELITSKSCKD